MLLFKRSYTKQEAHQINNNWHLTCHMPKSSFNGLFGVVISSFSLRGRDRDASSLIAIPAWEFSPTENRVHAKTTPALLGVSVRHAKWAVLQRTAHVCNNRDFLGLSGATGGKFSIVEGFVLSQSWRASAKATTREKNRRAKLRAVSGSKMPSAKDVFQSGLTASQLATDRLASNFWAPVPQLAAFSLTSCFTAKEGSTNWHTVILARLAKASKRSAINLTAVKKGATALGRITMNVSMGLGKHVLGVKY